MMGILVFKSAENHVFFERKKKRLPIVDQMLKCMPIESPVRAWLMDAWSVWSGGPQVVNESMRTRADLSKLLCADIFLIWFDVNMLVSVN